jgi:putative modified peptide
MANDTVIPKAQAVALLQKLSTDDAFRAAYKANPRDVLIDLGVHASALSASMAPLTTLADKLVFAHALAQVQADLAECHSCLRPPTVQFSFGK